MILRLGLNAQSMGISKDALLGIIQNSPAAGNPLTPGLKKILLRIRSLHVRNFMSGGARQGGWKKLTWWSAILRKKAGKKVVAPVTSTGNKQTDRANVLQAFMQIKARAAEMRPLTDTGDLLRSIQGQTSDSVENVDSLTIEFGTRRKDAELHQEGGNKPFQVTMDLLDRLQSTIGDKAGKGKPTTTPTGRKSRAKATWNVLYFILLHYFWKRSGSVVKIPARPFIFRDEDFNADDVSGFEQIMQDSLPKGPLP